VRRTGGKTRGTWNMQNEKKQVIGSGMGGCGGWESLNWRTPGRDSVKGRWGS
jgi:hypothetical protein